MSEKRYCSDCGELMGGVHFCPDPPIEVMLRARLSSARELVEKMTAAVIEWSDAMNNDSDKELIAQAEAWLKESGK